MTSLRSPSATGTSGQPLASTRMRRMLTLTSVLPRLLKVPTIRASSGSASAASIIITTSRTDGRSVTASRRISRLLAKRACR